MIKTKFYFQLLAFVCFAIASVGLLPVRAQAAGMPTAAGSPLAGIAFDDRPLMLPDHRNFQMAMITASSEMGRSCGRMESYGWRLGANEQNRVNLLFNNTVDRLRAQGFTVEPRDSKAVAEDVTLFTADRADKHLLALWSAGEIGLVMVLCETSVPVTPMSTYMATNQIPRQQPAVGALETANTVRSGYLDRPVQLTRTGKVKHEDFTPKGRWVGKYTCIQGTTGAELKVDSMKGDQFKGTFSFYPTDKNPFVPKGSYKVFGEYDSESLRILINPGKWIERPDGYHNTIMIGSFDPVNMSFSAYFQGITGCTSFEANYEKSTKPVVKKVKKKKKKVRKKKKPVKKVVKKKDAPKPVKKAEKKAFISKTTTNKLPVVKDIPPADSIMLDAVQ